MRSEPPRRSTRISRNEAWPHRRAKRIAAQNRQSLDRMLKRLVRVSQARKTGSFHLYPSVVTWGGYGLTMTQDRAAFEGWVSHASLGDEVEGGRIVFEGWRLRFESERVIREVLLVKLRIARDDAPEGAIVLCDPEHPDWLIHTLDERILKASPLWQQPHTRN